MKKTDVLHRKLMKCFGVIINGGKLIRGFLAKAPFLCIRKIMH